MPDSQIENNHTAAGTEEIISTMESSELLARLGVNALAAVDETAPVASPAELRSSGVAGGEAEASE